MKKLFYLLILGATVISCEKEKVTEPDPAPTPTLVAKWTIANIIYVEYTNGTVTDRDTLSGNGGTMDFQANGTLIGNLNGSSVTYPYTMKPDSKVEFDGDTYEIRDLKNTSVTLYNRDNWGG